MAAQNPSDSPILIVPYMWIGDFVRGHSVVKVLRQRWPGRPIDMLTTSLCAPLIDYMPGVRKGIEWNLPRRRLPLGQYFALAARLRRERYGTALILLRTWKSALAPFLAGIPERVGFAGEARFVLLNDVRWGEYRLERMVDRCGALALPKGAAFPAEWPRPELIVPKSEIAAWRAARGLDEEARSVVALCPGAVGRGKRWPAERFAALAGHLTSRGVAVWVLGGPNETPLAAQIVQSGGALARDLTGTDLRNAILALAAVDAAVSNDSGLMHVAAAIGTQTVGLFGPTSPRLWAPLNPLAATIEAEHPSPCPICGKAACGDVRHRSTEDIALDRVADALALTLETRARVAAQ
ncbi:MAG TPA: lipopolysaccharide heptosyltransferase II [Pseudorhodoplanes sp.]|jgi:heptosyltransferase-2|nr:lipopolysaccharide heptosyltransferase II [Pseudorhodoplanes sp.]